MWDGRESTRPLNTISCYIREHTVTQAIGTQISRYELSFSYRTQPFFFMFAVSRPVPFLLWGRNQQRPKGKENVPGDHVIRWPISQYLSGFLVLHGEASSGVIYWSVPFPLLIQNIHSYSILYYWSTMTAQDLSYYETKTEESFENI